MGMFDSFKMPGIEMPDGSFTAEPFQTKSLACDLIEYHVTPDGRVQRSVKDDDNDHIRWQSSNLTATNVRLANSKLRMTADFFQGRLARLDIVS